MSKFKQFEEWVDFVLMQILVLLLSSSFSFPRYKAQQIYIDMIEKKLNQYPTTIQEDITILNSEPDDQRLVAATRYRHCKKHIMHNHVDLLKTMMAPFMKVLLKQEESGLKPNDPKGIQINYLQK